MNVVSRQVGLQAWSLGRPGPSLSAAGTEQGLLPADHPSSVGSGCYPVPASCPLRSMLQLQPGAEPAKVVASQQSPQIAGRPGKRAGAGAGQGDVGGEQIQTATQGRAGLCLHVGQLDVAPTSRLLMAGRFFRRW